MTAPLGGIRVVDLSQLIAGPLCAAMLGDLGAEVLKVERPGGDLARAMTTPPTEASALYLATNRGKRSITIDLKESHGLARLRHEIERCDILIEGFRPGVMDRLGLSFQKVTEWNDKIIYASVSGFVRGGADEHRPGVDAVLQAESGLMAATGESDGPPQKVGVQIVDTAASLVLTQAILAALRRRDLTGEAQRVTTSLQQAATLLQAVAFTEASMLRSNLPRRGNTAGPTGYPTDLFECGDGKWIQVAAYLPAQWAGLCDVLGDADLATDARFRTNEHRIERIGELRAILAARFATNTQEHWRRLLQDRGILAAAVRGHGDVLEGSGGEPGILFSPWKTWGDVEYRDVLLPFAIDGMERDGRLGAPA